jgi:ABC-2 type transport system permease protein
LRGRAGRDAPLAAALTSAARTLRVVPEGRAGDVRAARLYRRREIERPLKKFLEQNKYAKGPYPDTIGFVAAIREAPPPELQYLVTDMFESIVLYENKTVSAVATPEPGNKYKVTLTVNTAKRKADGSGNETPMALNDLIDVGVFSGTKEHMEKRWFKTDSSTVAFIVDEKPTFAGIDPYNKLIDRNPEDNLIAVAKK